MAIDRTTPIGLYNFGVAYLDTARLAGAGNPQPMFSDPIEFLCAHGLELIFKADLARHMDVEKIKKDYGHNLIKLFNRLSSEFRSNFVITSEMENVIQYLRIGHSGPNWRNRYIETRVRPHLTPSQLLIPLKCFNTDAIHRKWLSNHFSKVNT
jgi:hypothetical protein